MYIHKKYIYIFIYFTLNDASGRIDKHRTILYIYIYIMKITYKSKQNKKKTRNTKYKGKRKRKHTYVHKKKRQARSRRRIKRSQAGSNPECIKNEMYAIKREPACDGKEDNIEMEKIKEGKGYCSGKYCISEDTIESIRAADKNNRYKDPWTRRDLTNAYLTAKSLEKKNIVIKSFEEIGKKIQEPMWSEPIASFKGHISKSIEEKNIAIRKSFKEIQRPPSVSWKGLLAAQAKVTPVARLLIQYAKELVQYAEELRKSQQSITGSSAKYKGLIASSRSATAFARLLNKYAMGLIQYAKEL
jgi:hypothetical protein